MDWAAAFQLPEFCPGLQTVVAGAIAETIGARGSTESSVTALEQLGEVCPTATVSAPEAHATTKGALTAPSFIGISGSPSLTQSSAVPQGDRTYATTASELHVVPPPTIPPGINNGLNQAFILGPGRPRIPAKLVTQILAYKFTEMADILPDNLGNPTSEIPSFLIEGCSIVPTTNTPSRKKSDVHDILTWVECFSSYIAIITSFRPERARDLLAYMALIIRIVKQFLGRCWYNYDRAFRPQVAASNFINWTQINFDLYHYHTSVAVQTSRPQTSRMREPRGNQNSPHCMQIMECRGL